MAAKSDLQLAFETLRDKQRPYTLLWRYYEGDHPLIYTARRLRDIFKRIDAKFSENWCAVVADSALDRLDLKRFDVEGDDDAAAMLNELWEGTELSLDADSAHAAALVCGEGYVIAWKDDNNEVEAYYNDPRLCHLFYDPERPRIKRMAAKWWTDEEGFRRLNLYYPDRIQYYRSKGKSENVRSWKDFAAMETAEAENPFGEIPVFRFVRDRRAGTSELDSVVDVQNAVNKLLADMMVAAEFGAARQRFVISNADNLGTLKNAPNEIWTIPAGDGEGDRAQVGDLPSTDLKNFLDGIEQLIHSLAIISRTPKHYFFAQGGDPSGEALIAMEAPLNHKVAKYQERLGSTWRELAAFLLKLSGTEVKAAKILPVWEKAQTVQPLTEAQIRQINVSTGIPLDIELRREGWTDQELADLDAAVEAKRAQEEASLAASMASAQKRLDRGGSGA